MSQRKNDKMDTFKNTVNSIFLSPTEGKQLEIEEIAQEAAEHLVLVDDAVWGQIDTRNFNLPISIEIQKDIQVIEEILVEKSVLTLEQNSFAIEESSSISLEDQVEMGLFALEGTTQSIDIVENFTDTWEISGTSPDEGIEVESKSSSKTPFDLSIKDCRYKFWHKTNNGINQIKRDKHVTVCLGKGPFDGYIGIGVVHTTNGVMNKTIEAAGGTNRILYEDNDSYKINDIKANQVMDLGPNPMVFSAKPLENGDAISKYATFEMPKYGKFYGTIMDISKQSSFCLSFNTVSSEKTNGGSKQCNRLWNLIVFPINNVEIDDVVQTYHLNASFHDTIASLPIQVMAEQRWKKPAKRTHLKKKLDSSSAIESFIAWADSQNIPENKRQKMIDVLKKP